MKAYKYSEEMHQRLFDIRKALKKTQRAMSKEMGYSGPYYSKLEKPGVYIGENVVLLICSVFDINYDYLVYGKGAMFDNRSMREKALLDRFNNLSESFQDILLKIADVMADSQPKRSPETTTDTQ